jgi:phosphoserine phosphatase RsbU/P
MSQARLKIEVAGLKAYEVDLEQGINKVGRAIDNTIGLRDMNVSRYHFSIKGEGQTYIVIDAGSRNGTVVNGKLVKEKILEKDDQIVVGSSTLTFIPPSSAQTPLQTDTPADPIDNKIKVKMTRMFEPLPPGAATPNPDLQRAPPPSPWADSMPKGEMPAPKPIIGSIPNLAPAPLHQTPPISLSEEFSDASKNSLFEDVQLFKSIKNHRERWRRLAEIAEIIGVEKNLTTLLESIVDVLLQLVPARGAFLVLLREDESFKMEVARNIETDDVTSQEGRYRLSTQIARRAVNERKPILTESAQEDSNYNQYLSVADLNLDAVLCMPFGVRDKVLGVVYLDNPRLTTFIGQEEELLEIVSAFGNLTGVAVWNAQLLASTKQQERTKQELAIAARIQRSLLPKQAPIIPGLELDGRSSPAKEIGGDLYDFLERGPPHNDLLIAIGDVSGKGVGAGLVGSSMRSLLHAFSSLKQGTHEILIEANRILAKDLEPGMFVSFVLIRIDPESGQAFYTGAGHEHLIIYRAKTKTCEKLKAGGVVLGLSSDLSGRLEEKPLHIDKGDMVVLYTDGATEATDDDGEEFGINRVGQVVLNFAEKKPAEVVHALFETVTRFHGRDVEQEDDLTIVTFRRI